MLVVGGVDVGEVGGEGSGGVLGFEVCCAALSVGWAVEEIWDTEGEWVVGSWCPGFEVGHLDACGGVDAVGGFHEGYEHDGFEVWFEGFLLYGFSDGVDAGAVFWFEVAGIFAEGFGEVAGVGFDLVKLGDELVGVVEDFFAVGLDIAAGEGVRVSCVVIGGDLISLRFERMSYA